MSVAGDYLGQHIANASERITRYARQEHELQKELADVQAKIDTLTQKRDSLIASATTLGKAENP